MKTGTASDSNNNGLNVNSVDMDSCAVSWCAAGRAIWREGWVQFIPALRAGWEHEFMDKTADMNARFHWRSGDFTFTVWNWS